MPDAGRLTEDRVPVTTPVIAPAYPAPPWKLPGARILKLMFETDKDAVLAWLPPKLTRSSPPYATVTIEDYPESPVGPFTVAHQHIGCRAGFFMRSFALQSVVNSERALTALREVWGFPCKLGAVSLEGDASGARAIVKRGRRTVADIRLEAGERIDTDAARFDPMLTLRLVPSLQESVRHDLVQLLQIDPEYEIRDAIRGRGSIAYPSASEDDPWAALPNLNTISAIYATLDTELPLARFVMPY